MLLLMFHSGKTPYAIGARSVVELIPRIELRPIPHAPSHVAGLLAYRGRAVPVVDFAALIGGGPATDTLGTRLIIVEFLRPGGPKVRIGLIAEDVSRVLEVTSDQFVTPVMRHQDAPYLGRVVRTDEGLVQLIEPEELLSPSLKEGLCGDPPEPG